MPIDDETFLAQFCDQTLNPEHFDHRGHLRVGWLYLNRLPLPQACTRVCDGIRALAMALGAADKFHHTISEGLVRIIAERMAGTAAENFDQFLAANPDLLADARGLLTRHYSDACLHSAAARCSWVQPDLAPLVEPSHNQWMQMLTITAFARRFNLSRSTLLYYDRIGLLKPASTSDSGYRLYGERELARMERIETFRNAGLPLKAIRDIVDGECMGSVEVALERQLAALNDEITRLRAQQKLVVQLLGRGAETGHAVDVAQWVAMLEEAGVDKAGRRRWHAAFERDAPQAHREFLQSLGLDDEEIAEIRRRSRQDADGDLPGSAED
ncbi:MerR family transcriptional regulator [Microbulbifer marinus]|uniref:DNA-binding transcriptional regulator, MerR family n=1 Tax=Microbulbifer marinus TaxID=658218 RepID=A0A1H3VTZ6_9GAMM|nr:MerR family transcriptional regulator [Microbulbifer marinus]SDZ78171.1 DNA-binding transcriptional regulator, MerR family [Microbulbifer marinus]